MKRYFDEYKAALTRHHRARRAGDDAHRAVTAAEHAYQDARRTVEATGAEVRRTLDALNAALLKVKP